MGPLSDIYSVSKTCYLDCFNQFHDRSSLINFHYELQKKHNIPLYLVNNAL